MNDILSKDIAELSQTEFSELVKYKLCDLLDQHTIVDDLEVENLVNKIINLLAKNEICLIPARLNYSLLGDAAIAGVFETGNPNHGWDYLVTRSKVLPKYDIKNK